MAIYKPSLLDKFKDFVNGLKGNWDQYEDHVADFDAHLAESASDDVHGLLSGGKLIEESGSNANGHYIKLSNGYAFAYRRVNIGLQYLDEGVSYLTYTLPISIPNATSFLNLSVLTGQQVVANLVTVINGAYVESAGTSWGRIMVERKPTSLNNSVYIELFAIGRWK